MLVTETDALYDEERSLRVTKDNKKTRHLLTLKQGNVLFDSKQSRAAKSRNTLYN